MIVNFNPAGPEFEEAAAGYRTIWNQEGARIVSVWEAATGLSFRDEVVEAKVFEGISRSHPLELRASYPSEVKKSILIHELGHRLIGDSELSKDSLELHKTLFLILFDVYVELYGEDYANRAVAWESANLPKQVYASAWDWSLQFLKSERLAEFKKRIK